MLTHTEAATLFQSARNPENGKPLANNTRLYEYPSPDSAEHTYAVCLHGTDVVTIHPDGTYTIATGGYKTNTTKARIKEFSPAHVCQRNYEWFLIPTHTTDVYGEYGTGYPNHDAEYIPFAEHMRVDALGNIVR